MLKKIFFLGVVPFFLALIFAQLFFGLRPLDVTRISLQDVLHFSDQSVTGFEMLKNCTRMFCINMLYVIFLYFALSDEGVNMPNKPGLASNLIPNAIVATLSFATIHAFACMFEISFSGNFDIWKLLLIGVMCALSLVSFFVYMYIFRVLGIHKKDSDELPEKEAKKILKVGVLINLAVGLVLPVIILRSYHEILLYGGTMYVCSIYSHVMQSILYRATLSETI